MRAMPRLERTPTHAHASRNDPSYRKDSQARPARGRSPHLRKSSRLPGRRARHGRVARHRRRPALGRRPLHRLAVPRLARKLFRLLPSARHSPGLLLFMPTAALRPCPHPGCGKLVASGHCDAHRRARQQQVDARRESSSKRGYTSRWQNYRRHFLRLHPLCGDQHDGSSSGEHSACVRAGRVSAATDVDHRVPHRGDKSLFWQSSNHQSLCHECHSAKTAREDCGFGHTPRGGRILGTDRG